MNSTVFKIFIFIIFLVNIENISTSEIKLSVIIDEDNTLNAIKKLHTIFAY